MTNIIKPEVMQWGVDMLNAKTRTDELVERLAHLHAETGILVDQVQEAKLSLSIAKHRHDNLTETYQRTLGRKAEIFKMLEDVGMSRQEIGRRIHVTDRRVKP